MLTTRILVLLIAFFVSVNSVCVNKDALSNISALVRPSRGHRSVKVFTNFYLLENYTVIDVYQANVTELCESMIKNFPRLEVLSLINVNLSSIQANSFQDVHRLRELSLSVNHLKVIIKGSFSNLPLLEILYLSGNEISYIDADTFSFMPRLKSIHLDNNRITQVYGTWFSHSPSIAILDLRHNLISKVTGEAFVDLQHSKAEVLTIYLSSNQIDYVEGEAFKELHPVHLHLEGNRLSKIEDLLDGVAESSKIWLNRNQFECVPDDVVQKMRNTATDLFLLENPLSCDCLDKIDVVLGEVYGKGRFLYNSSFPCEFAQIQFNF